MLLPIILMFISMAVFMVLRRAGQGPEDETLYEQDAYNINNNNAVDDLQEGDDDEYVEWENIDGLGSFFFLAKYTVELMLAWFVYFPIVGSVMFSGVLGCGRLPILGGRPKDIRLVEEESKDYRMV